MIIKKKSKKMQLVSSLQTIIFEYVFPRDVKKILIEVKTDWDGDMHMLLLIMERLKITRKEFMRYSQDIFIITIRRDRLDVMICLCMQFKPSLEEFMGVKYIPFLSAVRSGNLDILKYIATRFELRKKFSQNDMFEYGIGMFCRTKNIKTYEWLRQHFDLTFNENDIITMFKYDSDFPKPVPVFVTRETTHPITYFIVALCERGETNAAAWIYKVLRWKKNRLTNSLQLMGTHPSWDKFYKWYHALPDN